MCFDLFSEHWQSSLFWIKLAQEMSSVAEALHVAKWLICLLNYKFGRKKSLIEKEVFITVNAKKLKKISFVIYVICLQPQTVLYAGFCIVHTVTIILLCTCSQAHQMLALILLWRFRSDTPYSVNRALVSDL